MTKVRRFAPLFLFLFGFLLYSTNLKNEFVNHDDWWLVHNADFSRRLTLEGLSDTFFDLSKEARQAHGAEYLPVRDISSVMQYRFFGENPFPYHVIQNVLFSLSAVAIFELLLILSVPFSAAITASLLFVSHPIQVESVSWLSEHKDILSLLFLAWSLVLFTKGRWKGSWFLFVLALGSKYVVLIAPVFLPMIDRCLQREGSWKRYAPFVLASATALGVSSLVAHRMAYDFMPFRLQAFPIMVEAYIRQLVLPLHLQVFYPSVAISFGTFHFWLGLFEILCLVGLGIHEWKKSPILSLAVTLFLVGLLPVLRISEINWMADRYLLIPSIGFALLLGLFISRLPSRWTRITLAGLLVISCSILTVRQNKVWASSVSLWDHAAHGREPVRAQVFENLAVVHREAGNWANAAAAYEQVIYGTNPGAKKLSEHWLNLGFCRLKEGKTTAAEEAFRQSVSIDPTSAKGHMNLGIALAQQSKFAAARKSLETARDLDRSNVEIVFNLAKLAVDQQRWADVRGYIKELEAIVPRDPRLAQLRVAIKAAQ